jgi:uncharacterized protein (TIGR00730 family)
MKIAVYCSSCANLASEYVTPAQVLGEWIGKNGHELVFGGVNAGLMHVVSQATHDSGGKVIGVIPTMFLHRASSINDEVIKTHDLNGRKSTMIDISDLFVVLPGGIGTIDEWISTLSHVLCVNNDNRGIIVVNINHMYNELIEQLETTAASPFARRDDIDRRSTIVNNVDELKDALLKFSKEYEK